MNLLGIIIGISICIGSIFGYIPQFYRIIKYDSIEGISELSLVIGNIGLMCLTMNSIISCWYFFFCNSFECFTNLLPFIQICLSWVMMLIYYIIFIIHKYKKKSKYSKRFLYGLQYTGTYIFFILFVIGLGLGEKLGGHNPLFFKIFADILGYTSAVLNTIVYIPQIVTLYNNKNCGNLSFYMYIFQTPGNIIIIYFQAILYQQALSTWITYVIVLIEQTIILSLMCRYYGKPNYEEMQTL